MAWTFYWTEHNISRQSLMHMLMHAGNLGIQDLDIEGLIGG